MPEPSQYALLTLTLLAFALIAVHVKPPVPKRLVICWAWCGLVAVESIYLVATPLAACQCWFPDLGLHGVGLWLLNLAFAALLIITSFRIVQKEVALSEPK